MTKNFNVLRAKRSPEARARAHTLAKKYETEMALDELREARMLTQAGLAEILGVNQPAISKIEHQADMYVSTLRSIIRAMGGHLCVEAVFPEGRVEINQFKQLTVDAESEVAKKPEKQPRTRELTAAASR